MAKKPETDEDGDKIYLCEWCGAEFLSRQGRWSHEKKCEHRPTDDDETPEVPGDGINLFPDDEGVPVPAQTPGEDVPEYECPDCGHCDGEAYPICPVCGVGLVWQ